MDYETETDSDINVSKNSKEPIKMSWSDINVPKELIKMQLGFSLLKEMIEIESVRLPISIILVAIIDEKFVLELRQCHQQRVRAGEVINRKCEVDDDGS